IGNLQIDGHGCLFMNAEVTAGSGRSAAGRWNLWDRVIRSSRVAIVRPVRYSRLFLLPRAAFSAVRNARDEPPADRSAGRWPPRRLVLSPLPAAPRCRVGARSAPAA